MPFRQTPACFGTPVAFSGTCCRTAHTAGFSQGRYARRLYIFGSTAPNRSAGSGNRLSAGNPLIANTFFRAGFIEAWGRGIEKIKDSCREVGNPMPEYTIKREDIMVMFKSLVSYTDQATNQATDQANDNSVAVRILKVIENEPMLSQKKIANIIGEKI